MNVRELIERKKRGGVLARDEVFALVRGFTAAQIPDYQMSAFLMSVWFNGLDRHETLALTEAMMQSGRVLDLSDIDGAKIDKHSTGGIGDKVSLPLIGLAVAAGLRVPMLSGRGLGHTGGTLDKLEAIPGYDTSFDEATYRSCLQDIGGTIIGQSADLAPADGKLYALRDVTATVDSIPLIVASILSKKFAAGAEGVALDVKVGSGAFMRDMAAARQLAQHLVDVGREFGRPVTVLFTRMDEPLGSAVGNAVEVIESVEMLRGRGPSDLREVTLALVAEMLLLGKHVDSLHAGLGRARELLESGAGLESFRHMVERQGGRLDWERDDLGLELAPIVASLTAPQDAVLKAVNGYEVGMAVVDLGGGRQRKEDDVDYGVGLRWNVRIGQRVRRGQVLAEVLGRPEAETANVVARLSAALEWTQESIERPPVLLGRLSHTETS